MDIQGQKSLVVRFLRQCNTYADGKLRAYAARLATADPPLAAETEAKIAQWQSYKAFNEHAIEELATDRLDHWFEDSPAE